MADDVVRKGQVVGYTALSKFEGKWWPDLEDLVTLKEAREYVKDQRELPRPQRIVLAKVVAMEVHDV